MFYASIVNIDVFNVWWPKIKSVIQVLSRLQCCNPRFLGLKIRRLRVTQPVVGTVNVDVHPLQPAVTIVRLYTMCNCRHRIPRESWWLKLRPLLRILAKHETTYVAEDVKEHIEELESGTRLIT